MEKIIECLSRRTDIAQWVFEASVSSSLGVDAPSPLAERLLAEIAAIRYYRAGDPGRVGLFAYSKAVLATGDRGAEVIAHDFSSVLAAA